MCNSMVIVEITSSFSHVYCMMYIFCFCDPENFRLFAQRFLVQKLHFLCRPQHQEVDYVCGRFCGDGAQHQSRIEQPTANEEDTHTDSQTHSRGNTTAVKTKGRSFVFVILGELPRLFSQPGELRAACSGLSPSPRLQQHTPHPPDWPVTPRHAKPHHEQAGPTHRHTYPNTSLSTINHYSRGLGGLLELALATMTQRATTTPPAPFFP